MNPKKRSGHLLALLLALVLIGVCVAVPFGLKSLYPVHYDDFVETYAKEYGLKKSFVLAVIKCESSFRPDAVSSVGACGLMQMMPETFQWLQKKNGETLPDDALFDPETAIRYGCFYLQYLLQQLGDEALAVCAYHAGIGNVKKWLGDRQYSKDGESLDEIPFPTAKKYLKRVRRAELVYQKVYHFQ